MRRFDRLVPRQSRIAGIAAEGCPISGLSNRSEESHSPSNNLLQRSVNHKVLGRGRPSHLPTSALRARVLERTRAVAEQGR